MSVSDPHFTRQVGENLRELSKNLMLIHHQLRLEGYDHTARAVTDLITQVNALGGSLLVEGGVDTLESFHRANAEFDKMRREG